MTPLVMQSRAIAICCIATAACGDPRMQAARALVRFAQDAPFTIAAPTKATQSLSIRVRDDALKHYNAVFAYVDSGNPRRGDQYQSFPAELLIDLPITRVLSSSERYAGNDTMIATFAYLRPDSTIYESFLRGLASAVRSTGVTPAQVSQFDESFGKVRKELQQVDTVFIWIIEGPRVVRFRTASEIRDSVRFDELISETRPVIARVVNSARFVGAAVDDYSHLAAINPAFGGGSVKGFVLAGPPGWYQVRGLSVLYQVQCRAGHDDPHAQASGYLDTDTTTTTTSKDYFCLWTDAAAGKWRASWRRGIDARLVATFGADSVAGAWQTVH